MDNRLKSKYVLTNTLAILTLLTIFKHFVRILSIRMSLRINISFIFIIKIKIIVVIFLFDYYCYSVFRS